MGSPASHYSFGSVATPNDLSSNINLHIRSRHARLRRASDARAREVGPTTAITRSRQHCLPYPALKTRQQRGNNVLILELGRLGCWTLSRTALLGVVQPHQVCIR